MTGGNANDMRSTRAMYQVLGLTGGRAAGIEPKFTFTTCFVCVQEVRISYYYTLHRRPSYKRAQRAMHRSSSRWQLSETSSRSRFHYRQNADTSQQSNTTINSFYKKQLKDPSIAEATVCHLSQGLQIRNRYDKAVDNSRKSDRGLLGRQMRERIRAERSHLDSRPGQSELLQFNQSVLLWRICQVITHILPPAPISR